MKERVRRSFPLQLAVLLVFILGSRTIVEVKRSSGNIERKAHLLIVGAGPFGLAMAAYASHLGIEHLIVGKPMGFWKANMPKGMYLLSACDWHLDPLNVDTIEKFLRTKGLSTTDVEPLSLELYLSYVHWFQEQKQISVLSALVRRLELGSQPSLSVPCPHGQR